MEQILELKEIDNNRDNLKFNFNKNELAELYLNQQMSAKEIAELKECSPSTIERRLHKFNIPLKKTKSSYLKGKLEIIKNLYLNKNKSFQEIGKILLVSGASISSFLKKNNIPLRKSGEIYNCVSCKKDFIIKCINQSICQECSKIKIRKYRLEYDQKNKDKINLRRKSWRKNNPDKVKAENKRVYNNHREKMLIRAREYRKNNPEKVTESTNKWKRNNPEKVRLMKREWAHKNPEKVREMRRRDRINNINPRLENDLGYYIKKTIRHRLHMAFYQFSKNGKLRKADEYGVDYAAIIKHLGPCPGERKDYNIDHIIPLSKFNFDDIEQVKIAFCPENHQWLKKEINNEKSNKIIIEMIPEKLKSCQLIAINNVIRRRV